jgi:(p)ppGpp synthase/HD superfamily hydrolase
LRHAIVTINDDDIATGGSMTAFTDRFSRAVDYARIAHATQVRKGSAIPYLYHLLGVASLVIEFGGNEDQAIAGLLHDTIEDGGAEHETAIRAQFGDAVADIVKDCTDGTAEGKANHTDPEAKRRDWIERKLAYLAHLKQAPKATLLVSACDKLHNARAIVQDLEDPEVGTRVFDRFTGGRAGTLGYYHSLAQIFLARETRVARVLDTTVGWMHELAGAEARKALGSVVG